MATASLFLLLAGTSCILSWSAQAVATNELEQSGMVEKRKPNFIRFGRSAGTPLALLDVMEGVAVKADVESSDAALSFGKKGSDPNFLRFGRSTPLMDDDEHWLVAEKRLAAGANANFLRFGKSADPNFLRFGKRSGVMIDDSSEPNFLRFGRKLPNNNFLRFGRASDLDKFDRESRQKPNFLRFG